VKHETHAAIVSHDERVQCRHGTGQLPRGRIGRWARGVHGRAVAPVTIPGTAAPVTIARASAPVTIPGTAAPVTIARAAAPVTIARAAAPVTIARAAAPVTIARAAAPVTIARAAAPVTIPLAAAPVTIPGTATPVTIPPAAATVTIPPAVPITGQAPAEPALGQVPKARRSADGPVRFSRPVRHPSPHVPEEVAPAGGHLTARARQPVLGLGGTGHGRVEHRAAEDQDEGQRDRQGDAGK
jgi:hypothetical protein